MALVKLANISPTIKIAIVFRKCCATNKTNIKTATLPNVDAKTIPYGDNKIEFKNDGNKPAPKITIATAKIAPELNPKTSGPANGFLNNVCINNPLTDKPTPTKTAVIAFGKR